MTFTREDTKMVKGVAILLMLCHHLFAYSDRIQDGNSYTPLLTFNTINSAQLMGLFGKTCVALFLFLGGLGTYISWQSRRRKLEGQGEATLAQEMSRLTLAKVKALYAPYLKVFCVMVPVALLLGDTRVSPTVDKLVWNALGLNISYNGEWWFFTDYLILLVAFPLMQRFADRRRATLAGDVLACFVWVAATTWVIPAAAQMEPIKSVAGTLLWKKLYETALWSPCFLMGVVCARWDVLSRAKSLLAGHGLACLGCALVLVALPPVRYILGVGYRYDFLYAPLMAVCLSVLATTRAGARASLALQAVGKHGTGIWLTHSFFCYHWCQGLVFAPHYAMLVLLLLLAMSWATTWLIDLLWTGIGRAARALDAQARYEVQGQ